MTVNEASILSSTGDGAEFNTKWIYAGVGTDYRIDDVGNYGVVGCVVGVGVVGVGVVIANQIGFI